MIRPVRYLFCGKVELGETYITIGDKTHAKPAKGRKKHVTKTLVVIAVQMREPKGFGRIRLRCTPDNSARQVISFVRELSEMALVLQFMQQRR